MQRQLEPGHYEARFEDVVRRVAEAAPETFASFLSAVMQLRSRPHRSAAQLSEQCRQAVLLRWKREGALVKRSHA